MNLAEGLASGRAFHVSASTRTADRQAGSLLEILYCNLDQWSKDAVNRKSEVRSAAQCTLEASYRSARGAKLDRCLARIRHALTF
jgi:hypothetical protein